MVFSSGFLIYLGLAPDFSVRNYKHFAILANYLSIMFARIFFLVVFIFVSCSFGFFLLYFGAHIYASCRIIWFSISH